MIYTNCYIENDPELKDIVVEDGKFKEILPHKEYSSEIETVDLKEKLVIPPFVESHIHLDATHTAEKFHFLHLKNFFFYTPLQVRYLMEFLIGQK